MVNALEVKSDQNERRLEFQRNELKQQHVTMQECFIGRQIGVSPSQLCFLPGTTVRETSKQVWVLRKHQQNLVLLTRPHIREIITIAVEAGFVSENIGKCATDCSLPDHDCAAEFYKALLVRVCEAPHVLENFLQLLLEVLKENESCRHLFTGMLKEIC